MELKKLVLQNNVTLSEVMKSIDQNSHGICFILEGQRLAGVVTDGDIRRAIIDGANLNDSIELVMNKQFFSLAVGSQIESIQKNLDQYKYIPILNKSGELVEIANAMQYHQIPLARPKLDGNELEYVTDCIQTGWISSQGKYVTKFEDEFRKYVGCSNALAVSNGTVALHLALVTLGIGEGDEVIVPNLTFASPVNAVLYVGAKPVLVDVNPLTMTIDPALARLAITQNTRAILPVHLYGHPADMTDIMKLATDHNLLVIEDCAEALGSIYKEKHVGNFGDAATFSFFGNKTITTGEGGMVVFRSSCMRERAKLLRDHGMSPERRYWHNEVGFNYRLTNIQSAIGLAQMERVKFFVDKKRWIAYQYRNLLSDINFLQLPIEADDVINSYWIYTIVLLGALTHKRDDLIGFLKNNGIESRPVFYPIHIMPPYQKFGIQKETYPISRQLSEGGISLPSSVYVEETEIKKICDLILFFLTNTNA